jgi:hypothetical protein
MDTLRTYGRATQWPRLNAGYSDDLGHREALNRGPSTTALKKPSSADEFQLQRRFYL